MALGGKKFTDLETRNTVETTYLIDNYTLCNELGMDVEALKKNNNRSIKHDRGINHTTPIGLKTKVRNYKTRSRNNSHKASWLKNQSTQL